MSESVTSPAATDRAAVTRGNRKGREGYVVSDKMDKTVVVEVEDHVNSCYRSPGIGARRSPVTVFSS